MLCGLFPKQYRTQHQRLFRTSYETDLLTIWAELKFNWPKFKKKNMDLNN